MLHERLKLLIGLSQFRQYLHGFLIPIHVCRVEPEEGGVREHGFTQCGREEGLGPIHVFQVVVEFAGEIVNIWSA